MGASVPALSYRGMPIGDRGEMLSLTDMWKAAGSPDGRRPDDWKKDSANRSFLDHVATLTNAPVEGIWRGQRGAGGGTLAHWHIALAYAKYLDHDFHMWCNETVRARMEGRSIAAQPSLDASAREIRLTHKHAWALAKAIGLTGNQAVFAANRVTKRNTGCDLLAEMGVTHLAAPLNDPLVIPTKLGQDLGGLSARKVNALLAVIGCQCADTDHKGGTIWRLTPKGEAMGAQLMDRERSNDTGSAQQLMWPLAATLKVLREAMAAEAAHHGGIS